MDRGHLHEPGTHVVLRAAAEASAVLKGVADVDPVFMTVGEKEAALAALAVLDAQVAAERLAILAVASDVAEAHGARDVAAWVRSQARLDAGRPRADVVLAGDLGRLSVVAAALREGRVSQAQAREICAGLREVPDGVDAVELERAQAWLVEQAQAFGPRELKVLAHKVFEVVAPDKADDHERKVVQRQERAARRRIHLSIRDAGDGTAYLRGGCRVRTRPGSRPTCTLSPRRGAPVTLQATLQATLQGTLAGLSASPMTCGWGRRSRSSWSVPTRRGCRCMGVPPRR